MPNLPSPVPRLWRVAGIATALLAATPVAAQSFGVATWNLTWLMDLPTHARWTGACGRHGWPTDTSSVPSTARTELASLPYCDVHNGMAFPREGCASDRDGWPRSARYPADHPCRESADLADLAAYTRKLASLRSAFAALDARGVRLVALQEVFDAGAVRAVLPPQWSVVTTRELAGTPPIAQQVGIAWKAPARVRDIRAVTTLADSGVAERPLRPGLAFTVDVGGAPVRALVVHLKAGCRSRDLDQPLTAKDAGASAARKAAVLSDCATLRYQLPALESWIDAHASRDFAVLGDFNRSLLREPVADSATYRTRLDGTSTADPVGPCSIVRDGTGTTLRCPARTRAMFPELNDGHPRGAVLWRARPPKGASCTVAGPRGNLAHNGIDHVVVSASLRERLTAGASVLDIVNYQEDGSPLAVGPATAMPSDHCPHVVTWTPRGGNTQ